jgi:hypothetical protein
MDPRGTGLSTPFTADLVKGKSDQELFDYVLNFRADTIGVCSFSLLRNHILRLTRSYSTRL